MAVFIITVPLQQTLIDVPIEIQTFPRLHRMNDSDDSSLLPQDYEWLGPILAASSCGCLPTTLVVMTVVAMVKSCLMEISTKLMLTRLALLASLSRPLPTPSFMGLGMRRSDIPMTHNFQPIRQERKGQRFGKRISMQSRVLISLLKQFNPRSSKPVTSIPLTDGVLLLMGHTKH